MIDSWLTDLRHSVRGLARHPGAALVIVLTLGLGIGANTAIFTLVNAVMIERLPFHDPDRLVVVWEESDRRPGRPNVVSPANFIRWRERADVFEQMAAMIDGQVHLTGLEPEELAAQSVTANYFR